MRLLLLFCLLLCMHGTSSAQLTVADVRQTWATRQGTIESATLSVRPKGLYMECGLYLTFSAQGATFNTNGDSLEVLLKFNLPEGSTVHDSWLWVGEEISKARIFDRWTASAIYEGIVKRRSDPSILFKNSATQYQLRVFPMARTNTRRVKISWLQPATLSREKTTLDLPFDLLKYSLTPLSKFNLLVWTNDRFKVPSLLNQPNTYFEEVEDTIDGGHFYRTVLNSSQFTNDVKLAFASPMRNGYFLNTGASEGEKFYQLAVLPNYFIPGSRGKKVALCLDFQSGNTDGLTVEKILTAAKNTMQNNLTTGDSFNIFLAGLTIRKAANRWLPAHPDTIRTAFNLLAGQLAQYSSLPSLLPTSIEWVKAHGNEGTIVLASNGNQFSNLSASNTFLSDVLGITPPTISINSLNFCDVWNNYFYLNNTYYYANSYLLSTLAAQTKGAYVKAAFSTTQSPNFAPGLESLFINLGTYTNTIDINLSPKDGFCYARLNVSNNGALVNLDRPVLQVGKYLGTAPFNLTVSGVLDDQLVLSNVEVPESEIETIDTLSREIWYGKFIQTLEAEQQTNPTINNILFNSLNNRVLSRYTAFLCLEDSSYYCDNCTDETQLNTSTDELSTSDSLVIVYPNPFETRTTIQIKAMFASNEHPTFEIYDLKGRLVYIFNLSTGVPEQKIEWDGQALSGSESPAGVYFGLMKMKDRTVVIKLVKV